MPQPRFLTIAEQVARHLQDEISRGRWSGTIPGTPSLAAELGVNSKTVESALYLLENEGVLQGQGAGRKRRIIARSGHRALRELRVALFLLGSADRGEDYLIELRHLLEEAGHFPFYPDKTLLDLGMDPKRVARFVKQTRADAWLVGAGSRDVLRWFSEQPLPAFALFGRREGLSIPAAGPDKSPSLATATRELIELGHRRITLLIRKQHRLPEPGLTVRAFLNEMEEHGIQSGDFNLPDWDESKAGFLTVLDSLFQLTPPTALIVDEAFPFIATQQFLAGRGIRVPEDVSLVCTDSDPNFAWCDPSVAHIHWDYRPVLRRIVRWAANVSQGKPDLRQTLSKAEFIKGGTIAAVPGTQRS